MAFIYLTIGSRSGEVCGNAIWEYSQAISLSSRGTRKIVPLPPPSEGGGSWCGSTLICTMNDWNRNSASCHYLTCRIETDQIWFFFQICQPVRYFNPIMIGDKSVTSIYTPIVYAAHSIWYLLLGKFEFWISHHHDRWGQRNFSTLILWLRIFGIWQRFGEFFRFRFVRKWGCVWWQRYFSSRSI